MSPPAPIGVLIDSLLDEAGKMTPEEWLRVLCATPFETESRPDAVAKLCTVLHYQKLQKGDVLFEEGDEDSDIYIILGGSVQVTKSATVGVINVCHAGSFCGELALLYSDPLRRSTMSCGEETHIARMEAAELVKHKIDLTLFSQAEKEYRNHQGTALLGVEAQAAEAMVSEEAMKALRIGTRDPANRTPDDLDYLMGLPELAGFFKALSKNTGQKKAVCNVLRSVTFAKDQTICVEGDPGNSMYIILWGRVSVSALNSATQEDNHIRDLAPGEHFGELALISDGIRTTTIVSREFTVLFQLDRAQYEKSFRQADEEDIIEKVEALQICPLFHGMNLKQLLRVAYTSELIMVRYMCI